MWYLFHLVDRYWTRNDERAETLCVEALTQNNRLFFHSRIGFGQLDDVRNSVQQLFVNTTRAMFADGAIRLDDIWAGIYLPFHYCDTDELSGMCMGYTLFYLVSN